MSLIAFKFKIFLEFPQTLLIFEFEVLHRETSPCVTIFKHSKFKKLFCTIQWLIVSVKKYKGA